MFIVYPTKEGGVGIKMISIKYGPFVPAVLDKLTLILYVAIVVEAVDVTVT